MVVIYGVDVTLPRTTYVDVTRITVICSVFRVTGSQFLPTTVLQFWFPHTVLTGGSIDTTLHPFLRTPPVRTALPHTLPRRYACTPPLRTTRTRCTCPYTPAPARTRCTLHTPAPTRYYTACRTPCLPRARACAPASTRAHRTTRTRTCAHTHTRTLYAPPPHRTLPAAAHASWCLGPTEHRERIDRDRCRVKQSQQTFLLIYCMTTDLFAVYLLTSPLAAAITFRLTIPSAAVQRHNCDLL